MAGSLRRHRLLRLIARLSAAAALTVTALGTFASNAPAHTRPVIGKDLFGALPDGTKVWRYALVNGHMRIRIITYGGIVQSIETPDKHGEVPRTFRTATPLRSGSFGKGNGCHRSV